MMDRVDPEQPTEHPTSGIAGRHPAGTGRRPAPACRAAAGMLMLALMAGCAPAGRETGEPAPPVARAPAPSLPPMLDTRVAATIAAQTLHSIAFSRDGRFLANLTDHGLYVVPVGEWDRGREVFLSSPAFAALRDTYALWNQVVAWSPDDSLIALDLYSEPEGRAMLHHVYLFDWRRGAGRFLPGGRGCSLEDWGRDGRILLNDSLGTDWIVEADGGRRERVGIPYRAARSVAAVPAEYRLWQSPSRWLADGGIVTMVYDEARDRGLLLEWREGAYRPLGPEGGSPLMEIVTGAASQGGISPSPDGNRIAWVEWIYQGGGVARSLLKLYDRRTGRVMVRAASDSSGSRDWRAPAWSPDGSHIALAAVRDTAASVAPVTIWIMKIE